MQRIIFKNQTSQIQIKTIKIWWRPINTIRWDMFILSLIIIKPWWHINNGSSINDIATRFNINMTMRISSIKLGIKIYWWSTNNRTFSSNSSSIRSISEKTKSINRTPDFEKRWNELDVFIIITKLVLSLCTSLLFLQFCPHLTVLYFGFIGSLLLGCAHIRSIGFMWGLHELGSFALAVFYITFKHINGWAKLFLLNIEIFLFVGEGILERLFQ